jgi:hypothetical protein
MPLRGSCLSMVQRSVPRILARNIALLAALLSGVLVASPHLAGAQTPYQIVWVVIGEASSGADNGSSHAGRQLFMASDLVSKSMANIKVEQVDVTPVVNELTVGQRLCLTAMNIRTLGPDRALIAGAPLSISVRQDHKQRLALNRTKRDICVQPNAAGEYPMRLTSMLPARDGTMRGAQVYIRVSDAKDADSTTAADVP